MNDAEAVMALIADFYRQLLAAQTRIKELETKAKDENKMRGDN